MPEHPTSNIGSTYFNGNECRSFNIRVNSSSVVRLSGVDSATPYDGQKCSEVFIVNKSGGNVELFDRADAWDNAQATAASRAFLLADNDSVTLRGLTNVNQVSAQGSGNGTIYYRTQYYSSNPIR
jgi:hypothetical protein